MDSGAQPASYSVRIGVLYRMQSSRDLMLVTHIHLVPRLRTYGARHLVLSCLVCNCCWLSVCIAVVVLCVLLSYVYLLYYVCIVVSCLVYVLLSYVYLF